MNYFELQNLLFRSDIDRTVTIFCKILNLQIDGLGANIKILCRSVAESPVCSCCHTIPWKYSKLNLLLKLRATKSRDPQAEPSSRHHRLTGRVWANIRQAGPNFYGVLSRNWLLLLNILVNICCRQANLRNILFADNPNIRGYCFTKKISPLKSEILFVNSIEST